MRAERGKSEGRARVMQKYDASMTKARRGTSEMEVRREQCTTRWKYGKSEGGTREERGKAVVKKGSSSR